MSSSDKRVHFGLGDEKQISSIEIRWPRGAVQTLKDVTADRILKVEEDVGHASACPLPAESRPFVWPFVGHASACQASGARP
jgi:hypothetical protein